MKYYLMLMIIIEKHSATCLAVRTGWIFFNNVAEK